MPCSDSYQDSYRQLFNPAWYREISSWATTREKYISDYGRYCGLLKRTKHSNRKDAGNVSGAASTQIKKAEQDVIEMETRNFKKDLEKYRVEAESKQAEEKRI